MISAIDRIHIRQASLMRLRKKSIKTKKAINVIRSKRPHIKYKRPRVGYTYKKPNYNFQISGDFCLTQQPDKVIGDINDLSAFFKTVRRGEVLSLNTLNIQTVDIGSLNLLLSVILHESHRPISVKGLMPLDEKCEKLFRDSGFLDKMKDARGRSFKRNNSNLLIETGTDQTSNEKVGKEIKNAVKHLTGIKSSYRPVYSMIQEICANSIEHANFEKNKKNWMLGIYYEDDKVIFVMSDKGKGILKTLYRKLGQRILDFGANHIDILNSAFDKAYQSVTKDRNRNKGLPKIKKNSDLHFVDNLIVITNDVFLNMSDRTKSLNLNNDYKGTIYYWELTKDSIETWKKRII